MTGLESTVPADWAGIFISWMHPSALVFGIVLPLLRAAIRGAKGHRPCFQAHYVAHDVASGFTIPSFVALILAGVNPELASHVDHHAGVLAGAMGLVYTIGGVLKGHHGEDHGVALKPA